VKRLLVVLEKSGDLLEPHTNQPFLIQGSDLVWIVRSGKLDIFLVSIVNGEVAGARRHLVRVEEGHPVFGMSLVDPCGVGILAVATPGTQLLCLPQSRLRELGRSLDPALAADAFSLVEDWISRLGAVAAGAPPPQFFSELKAGATLEVANEAKPIRPVDGIVWIEHLQGSSRFLNRPEIDAIGNGRCFPVSWNGWLQPEPQSRILSLPTEEWSRRDTDWQSLQAFHRTFVQCLVLARRAQEDKHRKRLQVQADSEAALIRGAVRALAWPLQERGGAPVPDEVGPRNPVLLACEAVGQYLGLKIIPSPEIRSGAKLRDPVASIARASSLRHRVVALKGKWWVDGEGPLVAFRDSDNRPLALLPGPRKGYNLYDPVEDTTIRVTAPVALGLNAFAYSFYQPLPNRKLSFRDLLTFGLRASRRELTTIVLLGVGGGLLGLVLPIATGIIFNSFIPNAERKQLLQMSAFLVIAALAGSMFALTRSSAALRLEGKLGASVQAAVWDRLLRLPVRFFRLYTSGDLAERSLGIEYILRMLTGSTLSSILSGVFSIFSFLLLFYFSWQLAVTAAGLMLVAFAVSAVCAVSQVRYQRRIFRLRGRIAGMLLQFADNIAKLHVSGTEPRAFAAWAREFAEQKELSVRAQNVTNYLTVFNSAFPVLSLAVIFSYAAHLMGQPLLHALTTGTFLAFLAAFIQFQSATLQLNSAVESVLGIVPLYERVAPIFESVPEVDEAKKHPGELSGALEISHLSFRYHPEAPLVLRDLSFAVRPGQFVAIVGPSGSGKSTLLRLLLGFEKPDSGAIYYDREDLAGLDIQAVRRQIGVVIQNARLGAGTIFESIVGSAPLTLADAWEAARMAGFDEDIHKMPMGMHTFISEGGTNLSGGQCQRLHIARAIVKKPRLFFFDEATSALDNQTQSVVSRSLEALQATRIVIAHRLSTIINAERILVIEKGTLVQCGSYEELVNREGLFRELAKRQLN
jgi:NHLM bacteriocin system ABC transporter ATP-binding protein